jgi:16S rRNA (guanine966-N2)-methyltransferase
MRIIGGQVGGRRIILPKGCSLRPTTDRVKEALFNILQPIAGKVFLDIFAGSGSVGIEALSRGAARVVFIEKNAILTDAIRKSVETFGFRKRCKILTMGVGHGIRELAAQGEQFDILFIDPPYEQGLIEKTLQYLEGGELLLSGAMVVIQHAAKETFLKTLSNRYVLTDQRKYGYTMLSFLRSIAGE